MEFCTSTSSIDWHDHRSVRCSLRQGHGNDHEGYPFLKEGDDEFILYWDTSEEN